LAINHEGRLFRYSLLSNPTRLSARIEMLEGTSFAGMEIHAPGDWNRDGHADVIVVAASGNMYLWVGDGRGDISLFTGATNFPGVGQIGQGWHTLQSIIPIGDLDGDGILDMLAIHPNGSLRLFRGNGQGGFRSGFTQVGHGWGAWSKYAAGDFDGDGATDALSIDGNGVMWARRGRGTMTPNVPGVSYNVFWPAIRVGHGWDIFTLGSGADLDGDGRADMIGRDDRNGNLFFYRSLVGQPGRFERTQIATGWGAPLG
jgi:hypothetical protein